jgi:hypothetical protein
MANFNIICLPSCAFDIKDDEPIRSKLCRQNKLKLYVLMKNQNAPIYLALSGFEKGEKKKEKRS